MTIVDRLNVAHDENNQIAWADALAANVKADVCWSFNSDKYKTMLKEALA